MRYIIGVDLGTTNSCVCFVDTLDEKQAIQLFSIPQIHSLGHIEALLTLPSFCFLDAPHKLPWNKKLPYIVGSFAREEGAKIPTKLVESAKSWLCHHLVSSRSDKLLPFEAKDSSLRISPVEATARFLSHLKEAWNHSKAKGKDDSRFEDQDIILTVPASFDEVARGHTLEAARLSGILRLNLLEEPQAAFYSWIAQHQENLKSLLKAGDSILVCDVGGGTTDFSLIDVHEEENGLTFQRMAVGDHLLLGGDNMDIAIAHKIENRFRRANQADLSTSEWLHLRHLARNAKEALLDEKAKEESFRFTLQGTGAKVIGNTLNATISQEEIKTLLLEGFFPLLDFDEALKIKRSSGVKAMGLPYEVEPAITRHLARFLNKSREKPSGPDYVLFNGGTMKPSLFQQAILESLTRWFPQKKPGVLSSYHLDLAVARGSAYYGKARRGLGIKIGGGSGQGYYLGIDVVDLNDSKSLKALTLLPRGSQEEAVYEPEQVFWLRPNTPVSFILYASNVRLHDQPGDIVDIDAKEMKALPPIRTVFKFGKGQPCDQAIPVRIGIGLSAIGTIEVWLKSQETNHRWALEFQLRSNEGKELTSSHLRDDETFDVTYLNAGSEAIAKAFSGNEKNERLMEGLEALLESSRKDWSPSILRGLWEALYKQVPHRKDSIGNEARWWNMAGFFLRPGFGYPLDDFRIKELWKIILADFKLNRASDVEIQRWICFRRIASGLSRGQQGQIAAELWSQILDKKTGKIQFKGKGEGYQYAEKLRTAASLEGIEPSLKIKLGNAILARMKAETPMAVEYWAIGRLGARILFHGGPADVISKETAALWIEKLLELGPESEPYFFALEQISRKSDQREHNLPFELIEKVLEKSQKAENYERLKAHLTSVVLPSQNEQNRMFGEQLPPGLVLKL